MPAYPGGYPAYPMQPPFPRQAGVSDMLSGTFEVWKKNFLGFFVVYLALAVATGALGGLLGLALLGAFEPGGGLFLGTPVVTDGTIDFGAIFLYSLLTILVSAVLTSIVTGGMTEYAVRRFRGESVTLEHALRRGLERFLSILGANILLTLILFALVLVPLLLILPAAILASVGGAGAGGALVVVCGLFLALAVGSVIAVFVYVSLSLYAPVVMIENARAVESLSRSWTLTKGHRWALFGSILVTFLLVAVISILIALPASLTGNLIASFVASALASAIVAPLMTILIAVAYDLIVRQPSWMPPPAPYAPMPPMAPPPSP